MTTTTEYVSEYRKEQELKEQKKALDIQALNDLLTPTLKELGLVLVSSKRNEDSDSRYYYIVKNGEELDDKRLFQIYVSANEYSSKGKYSFSVKSTHTHTWKAEKSAYHQNWEQLHFNYEWLLTSEQKQEIGLTRIDYAYPISQLNKDSKIDKNPKLIISDFLKVVTPYIKIIDLVAPIVAEKIKENDNIIDNINSLETAFKTGYQSFKAKERTFSKGSKKVVIDSSGNITVTHPITLEQALEIAKGE